MKMKTQAEDDLPILHSLQNASHPVRTTLTLPYDARKRSRQRVTLDDGQPAALMLPRGTLLRHGDRLRLLDDVAVEVQAAPEQVSTVLASDAVQLARVAYHLGNRHVPLQVGPGWLRYQHDHVLDDMVRGLGATVQAELAPFEPEAGAHAGGGHGHTHEDGHGTADHTHG